MMVPELDYEAVLLSGMCHMTYRDAHRILTIKGGSNESISTYTIVQASMNGLSADQIYDLIATGNIEELERVANK